MGRVKLAIKRLEHTNNRQITYSKRRSGILKKARELSILCDIDIFLVMFSPTGKPTVCLGERSKMEDVIARFSELTPQERSKRKLESLEALKKTFKKLNHDVNIEDFLGASNQMIEELHSELRGLQSQLADVQEKIWCYGSETEKITSVDQARDVEGLIQGELARLQIQKESMKSNQFVTFGNQLYHNGMCLPSIAEASHHPQPISWIRNHSQQIMAHEDPSLVLSHNRDINCVGEPSLSIPAGYIINCKQADMEGNPSQPETFSQALRLQLGAQSSFQHHQHHEYTQSVVSEEKKFKPEMDMGLRGTSIDYATHSLESIGAGFDGIPQQWPSSSSHAVMPPFNKYALTQQQQSMGMIESASTSLCNQVDQSGLEHSTGSQTHTTSECQAGMPSIPSLL